MKRILSSYYTKLFVFCQVFMLILALFTPVITTNVSAKDTNNFYFEKATFDYYLEKNENGTSKMRVVEELTAIFPDTNQNHGITRSIPYTNQDGENFTAESKNALKFSATRNGKPEEIAKTETENGSYVFYLGNKNSYVHGEQTYVLTYEFNNVITEFTSTGEMTHNGNNAAFQELYWDTNGTGWSQRFLKLTANLHLPSDINANVLANKTSCYVGRFGTANQSRCNISSSNNVITFTTTNLSAYENLTFAVDFKPGTFTVKAPQKSILLLVITIASALAGLAAIFFAIYKYNQKNKEKKSYYQGLFNAPQYQPYKNITVAEAEKICMHSVKSSKVATLLELAVEKKVQIIKTEKSGVFKKKNTWKIKVIDSNKITRPQEIILEILNGGSRPKNGEEFEVKTQSYSSSLATLSRSYPTSAEGLLKEKGFLEKSPKKPSYTAIPIAYFFIHLFAFSTVLFMLLGPSKKYLYGDICLAVIYGMDFIGIVLSSIIAASLKDYTKYTMKGLDLANYFRGLKLYISMAEKDRIKFLQSVKGADTSDKGIVKLYEKLLPYACLFGEEESWMNELNKYYENLDYEPYWYSGDGYLTGYMLGSMISTTNSSISSGTVAPHSSSSSGSSGGGGGGFSGGGGGGGGGGGW